MLISKDAPLGLQLNAPCLQRLLEVLSRIHSNGAETAAFLLSPLRHSLSPLCLLSR